MQFKSNTILLLCKTIKSTKALGETMETATYFILLFFFTQNIVL
jgi:hypothetical protein